jgi:hypothetical protein
MNNKSKACNISPRERTGFSNSFINIQSHKNRFKSSEKEEEEVQKNISYGRPCKSANVRRSFSRTKDPTS